MKIILSRKGFDADNGGTASPILPDGTMLSFPIPQSSGGLRYSQIRYGETTYSKLWKELKPGQAEFAKFCHLDPDLRPNARKELPENWVPIFGQASIAEKHLENQGVEVGDLFMFFGWFRETEEVDGAIKYKRGGKDIHALYGYLQIGSIVHGPACGRYSWHPHAKSVSLDNTMYIASEKLIIDGKDTELPGYGVFKFSEKVQLTMPGQSRSRWLLPACFKNVTISMHDKDCFKKEGYFQSVGRGQEFVVSEGKRITNWAYKIIRENIDMSNYINQIPETTAKEEKAKTTTKTKNLKKRFDFGNANDAQKVAIQTTEGPLLIIAGPGTGKTYTLVKRVVYLITEKNVQPEEIMVATFTEKAAKELITRVTNELYAVGVSIDLNEMYIGTFHSICLRILKEHLEYTRLKKNYRALDQFEQQYLVFQKIGQFRKLPNYDAVITKDSAWNPAGEIVKYVNSLVEELVDIDKMLKDRDPQIAGLAQIVKKYQEIIGEENYIDFSGLQTEAYRLFNEHPEILEELQQKIKYLMVDEYQDTNYIQEELVFMIAGKRKNICVVGDDDQGLYRFRGATIRNILEFPSHFPKNKCKQVKLVNNYRSEAHIIDFYNQWMHETGDYNHSFNWGNFRFDKIIKAEKPNCYKGTSVFKCSGNDPTDWYENVLAFITSLKKKKQLTDLNQIAFLTKSVKNDKIRGLINYLEENGIQVYSPRSDMFFTRQEVMEVLGCLMLCFPDYANKLEKRQFTYDFDKLYEYYDDCVYCANELIADKKNPLKKWIDDKQKVHSTLAGKSTDYAFVDLLYQLLQFEPFSEYIGIDMKSGVVDERPARNLAMLSSVLGNYEYIHRIDVLSGKSIERDVEWLFNTFFRFLHDGGIQEYEDDTEYAPSGCVSFMTIHQSKGMEFPIVIVDSLHLYPKENTRERNLATLLRKVETKYYHRKTFEHYDDIIYFDFWRLYYTAFSRAQNMLVLSCAEVPRGLWRTPSWAFKGMYDRLESYEDVDLAKIKLDKVKPVNLKDTFSFTSHIAVYENCAVQYKFFKELGFEQKRIGATLFGTLVHETIEDVHKAALRHEENLIDADSIRDWLNTNYNTLSKKEHSYLGQQQIETAYKQVLRYTQNNGPDWSRIQEAEVEVSLVKPDYILMGQVDLIRGKGDTVEIVDFKSEKKPDNKMKDELFERYRKQLEVYAYLVEEKTGRKVSKMHLYYTGDESGNPLVSFNKSKVSLEKTIQEFDDVVDHIHAKDFSHKAKDKKSCVNCDMRYYCKRK